MICSYSSYEPLFHYMLLFVSEKLSGKYFTVFIFMLKQAIVLKYAATNYALKDISLICYSFINYYFLSLLIASSLSNPKYSLRKSPV